VWRPLDTGARPYGPFVNRNHLATWIIMACPLAFGYLLARAPQYETPRRFSQRIVNALNQLGTVRIWLVVAVCIMTLAVLLSGSRSGLIGLMTAFVVSAALTRGRGTLAVRRWVIFQFTLLALVVLSFANYDVLLRRLEESMTRAQQSRGRLAIWRDTIRLIGDFPVTGTGTGTFGKAISVYQTAEPGYAIDQAHNHYLQAMAEGGASLLLPGTLAAGVFLLLASRSLQHDRSSSYLIRAGACAGIAGVLVQSVWETGLTMPANALLFAVLAAIATCGEPRAARGDDLPQASGWSGARGPRDPSTGSGSSRATSRDD
jgi:putative inorganic carbon (HCO3(-)) transporter